MIRQSLKDIYFIVNQWVVLPNTWLLRQRFRGRAGLRVHLGCGDDYIEGLLNVDGNIRRRKELWLDLRNPLPFADGSADLVYCSHTVEHLYPYEAIALLGEIRRVLSPQGVARMAVPSFEYCLDIVGGKAEADWPRPFDDPESQALNYLFCDGQHKYGYCAATLRSFAEEAGFRNIRDYSAEHGCKPSTYCGVEIGDEPPGSLVVELRPGEAGDTKP